MQGGWDCTFSAGHLPIDDQPAGCKHALEEGPLFPKYEAPVVTGIMVATQNEALLALGPSVSLSGPPGSLQSLLGTNRGGLTTPAPLHSGLCRLPGSPTLSYTRERCVSWRADFPVNVHSGALDSGNQSQQCLRHVCPHEGLRFRCLAPSRWGLICKEGEGHRDPGALPVPESLAGERA